MDDAVFHIDRDASLSALRRTAFAAASEMQALLLEHPALLSGDESGESGLFALSRVGPAVINVGGAPAWTVDHLFVSSDAVPILVEARRALDGPASTDLFGPLLHYAANAALWWPPETLASAFAARHVGPGRSSRAALSRFIGVGRAPDAFWTRVSDNLAAGRVRLVLAVDHILPEFERMVEFLASQMRETRASLLELRQHVGPSGRIVKVRLAGAAVDEAAPLPELPVQTPTLRALTAARRAHSASRETWLQALRERCDDSEATVLDAVVGWMNEQYGVTFVTGSPKSSYSLAVKEAGRERFPCGVTEDKAVVVHLASLAESLAFGVEDARRELIEELAQAGFDIPSRDFKTDLVAPFSELKEPARLAALLEGLDGVIESLRLKEARDVLIL
jgi:hypothetical protein